MDKKLKSTYDDTHSADLLDKHVVAPSARAESGTREPVGSGSDLDALVRVSSAGTSGLSPSL